MEDPRPGTRMARVVFLICSVLIVITCRKSLRVSSPIISRYQMELPEFDHIIPGGNWEKAAAHRNHLTQPTDSISGSGREERGIEMLESWRNMLGLMCSGIIVGCTLW